MKCWEWFREREADAVEMVEDDIAEAVESFARLCLSHRPAHDWPVVVAARVGDKVERFAVNREAGWIYDESYRGSDPCNGEAKS